MIEIKETEERAILVALRTRDLTKEKVSEHLSELEELANTAGATTVFKIIQDKASADKALYIGKGKTEEIAELSELNDITTIIFDDDLSPVQVRNLEKAINRKIVDRSALILDIFASRAQTKEAKTQVELAQLQYMLPRLTRAWTHLSKQYGGIGTKGPGETQIEADRRMIKNRISLLKGKLEKIEQQRETQSQKRKDFKRVSLVGYTNAGKSTLFNLMTKEDVLAEDRLFATLDSTTRIVSFDKSNKILMSDTVGFIRKLPHNLVASFKSTLNEVRESDVLLHIIDASNPYFQEHIEVVESTLADIGCKDKVIVKVFNKVDILSQSDLQFILGTYKDAVLISALRGMNIGKLIDRIISLTKQQLKKFEIRLPIANSKKIAMLYSNTKVLDVSYEDDYGIFKYLAETEFR